MSTTPPPAQSVEELINRMKGELHEFVIMHKSDVLHQEKVFNDTEATGIDVEMSITKMNYRISKLESFLSDSIRLAAQWGADDMKIENERLKAALDYITLVANKTNPHLGRPRSSDLNCIFCLAYLALYDGAYGEHIEYAKLAKEMRNNHRLAGEEKGRNDY